MQYWVESQTYFNQMPYVWSRCSLIRDSLVTRNVGRSWTPYCQIHTEIEESRKTTRPLRHDLNQIPYDYTVESEVAQLYLTLWDLTDCSPPGSSIHGILQARILEWVTIPFSRASSGSRDWTQVDHITGRPFTIWATWEIPYYIYLLYFNCSVMSDSLQLHGLQHARLP